MSQALPPGFEIEKHGPGAVIPDPTPTATPVAATPDASAPPSTPPPPDIPEGFEPEQPGAAPEEPKSSGPLSMKEFETQLYEKLNDPKGGSLMDIVDWSKTTGHKLVPDNNLLTTWKTAEYNRQQTDPNKRGTYGRAVVKGNDIDATGIGAMLRGAGGTLSLGFGDEASAVGKAALGYGEGKTYDERYRSNWMNNNIQDNIDEVVNGSERHWGQAAGLALSAKIPIGVGYKAEGTLLGNVLRGSGVGAVEGGIAGTGAGSPDNRFQYTMPGAEVGALAGAAAPVAAKAVGAVARPIADAVASRTGKGGAINALSRRMGITPQAMADKAASLRASGIEPTVYDVVGETGQDLVGSLARRPTAARNTMQTFADEARVGLPGRINKQAATISKDIRVPDEAVNDITSGRNAAMEAAMEPLRPQPVPLAADSPLWDVLRTGEGKNAIRAAAMLERDPEVKRTMMTLSIPPKAPEDSAEIQKMHDAIDAMGLAPDAAAAAKAQLPPIPENANPTMTVDMADKIARSFNDAAEVANRQGRAGRARVLRGYGQEVRGEATKAVPAYGDAVTKYGETSRTADAVRLGEEGLDRNTDEFVAKVRNLDTKVATPATGPIGSPGDYIDRINSQGTKFMNSPEASDYFTKNSAAISDELSRRTKGRMTTDDLIDAAGTGKPEGDLARLGFRRAIERKAGENVPRGALGVAESLALSPEQRLRTNALLGDQAGNALGRNMAAEVDVARNRMRNAPRAGSPTNKNNMDQQFLESMATIAAHPIGWKASIATGLRALSKKGISDAAAGRIVDMAVDATPGAVDQAITDLTKALKGNRKRATFLVTGIRKSQSQNQDQSHPE